MEIAKPRMRGLFVNSTPGVCSIYEVGLMCFEILRESDHYELDYVEYPQTNAPNTVYDFIIVNYHYATNNSVNEELIRMFGDRSYAIVTEMTYGDDPTQRTAQCFHKFIVLDPTVKETERILAFPRPLDVVLDESTMPMASLAPPVIGSFGLPTEGKRWDLLAAQVNEEFDEAIIRFHISRATFVPDYDQRLNTIRQECEARITKPGIRLEITSHTLSREEIVKWCAQNTINCFLYFRQHLHNSGLSAVVDQAIGSKRPLLVTKDLPFRHTHPYLGDNVYPNIGIRTAIEATQPAVFRMCEAWSKKEFLKKFENSLFIPSPTPNVQ